MKRWMSLAGCSGFLLAIALALACTTPSPQPPLATPTPSPPPVSQPATPSISPQDAAWAKVVEAAKKEGRVAIYSGSAFAGDKGARVGRAFTEKYGIAVEILTAAGRQIAERVKVEGRLKQAVGDVLTPGTSSLTELKLLGLTAKLSTELPNLADKSIYKIDPAFDPEGTIVCYSLSLMGLLVNTNLVSTKDEPRSWYDLLDPKWHKKIVLDDPRGGGGGGFRWFSNMLAHKALDAGYFTRFAQNEPAIFAGMGITEIYMMVARGEYPISPSGSTDSAGHIIIKGAPIKLLGMKEGNISLGDCIGIFTQAPHPNAARLFVNWLFSKEGLTIYVQEGGATPFRKDTPDFLHPKVKLDPEAQKLLYNNWEIQELANSMHKEGIAERIFGRR